MALQGDLSTLDLADLLQSLALHARTGTLTVAETSDAADSAKGNGADSQQQAEHLYFKEGSLTLYGSSGRPKLVDVLTACGLISEESLESARVARKGSRRSLGAVLVDAGAISQEQLVEVASSRLLDDACELIGSGIGAFRFVEGKAPRGLFDPEERRLELALAPSLLLLEAARRSDHWQMIKSRIPSAAGHYIPQRAPRPGSVEGEPDLLAALVERVDGTRSVAEVLACFPHRRFESYQVLANLCDARAIRLASADDMARLAKGVSVEDPSLAQTLVARGLDVQPQHSGLLGTFVELAEARGEIESATDALKMLAHMRLESGDQDGAREVLERAKQVDPSDRAVWQKSLTLAIEQDRTADAVADGRHLAQLFQAAGLHKRACGIFEQLVALESENWSFRSQLAHSRSDCGELERAVEELASYGRQILAEASFDRARVVFSEIHELDPAHQEAEQTIADIDTGKLERRRHRRRRAAHLLRLSALCLTFFGWLGYELVARDAYRQAVQHVHRSELLESRNYEEAARILANVGTAYPGTTTAMWDVPSDLELLTEKARNMPKALQTTPAWNPGD